MTAFHVQLDQGAQGRTTIIVQADSFTEGEHGITFTEFTTRKGATGHFPVKWLPSDVVMSISWDGP